MALTVTGSNKGDFKQVEPGSHLARCYRIIDLGTQQDEWQGETKHFRKVMIEWEVPAETIEIDGIQKPLTISRWYTASLGKKANLRRDLEGWRNKAFTDEELAGFDLKNVLTKPCMLSVIKSERGNSYISAVSAIPKGMDIPAQFNEEVFFSLEEYNQALFDSLPEGIQKIIMKSPEYAHATGVGSQPSGGVEDMVDDIPFLSMSYTDDCVFRKLRWPE